MDRNARLRNHLWLSREDNVSRYFFWAAITEFEFSYSGLYYDFLLLLFCYGFITGCDDCVETVTNSNEAHRNIWSIIDELLMNYWWISIVQLEKPIIGENLRTWELPRDDIDSSWLTFLGFFRCRNSFLDLFGFFLLVFDFVFGVGDRLECADTWSCSYNFIE